MLLTFPSFNLFSMPLLILVVQGYLFAFLLIGRYRKKKHIADLFLALLILTQGHHCTAYIIGFMDWYDTFEHTKVNYFIQNFTFAFGPLIFFYVKSITTPYFKFKRQDLIHFIPAILVILYDAFVYIYDAAQPGFSETQNGVWLMTIHFPYVQPFMVVLGYYSELLYYAFSIHVYLVYRKKIRQYFSNTYQVELNWIRNFLYLWIFLFGFHSIMDVINDAIIALHWQQNWWSYFAIALTILIVGIKGYFTDISTLYDLTFSAKKEVVAPKKKEEAIAELEQWKTQLTNYMVQHQPYLNPELTLTDLAKAMNTGTKQLSKVINKGFGKNFKDYINEYRVDSFKSNLLTGLQNNLSLLGIAFDSGFNSKATFNRTFKKFTNQTPSEFAASLKGN